MRDICPNCGGELVTRPRGIPISAGKPAQVRPRSPRRPPQPRFACYDGEMSGSQFVAAGAPLAPIGAHSMLLLLLQLAALLGLALLLGRLAVRLGWPAVVGELAAGVLLGPSLLGALAPGAAGWLFPQHSEQVHMLDAVAQLGVLLLVGISGSHLDVDLVRHQSGAALRVSLFGLTLPLALGVGLGLLLPASGHTDHAVYAAFLGVAMCVSAIPVIAKTLLDMDLLHRDIGQLTLTAGMMDDAVGWVLLSLVTAMATTGVTGGAVLHAVLALLVVLAAAVPLARWVIPPLFRRAERTGGAGVLSATATVLMLLAAAGTQALGLEPIFGAFVAGVTIAASRSVGPMALAPLRTVVTAVLAPVFLASAGLRMDLTALGRPMVALTAAAALLVAVAGKFGGAFLGARASRLNRWEALALGAGMNARGVVQVVIAMVGLRLGVLDSAGYTVIVLVAVVTSTMAPPVLRAAMARIVQTPAELRRRERQFGQAKEVERV
ncbi:Kef-type K+ transport system membrane component KefB [Kitasatospora sp. GP30]|nr:Kef-type K+ transport system membrane component KefB [Kitasatospora sp. GP30]